MTTCPSSGPREQLALDVATGTRQGSCRARNEDALASFASGRILALADGMSDRPDGHIASTIAIREVRAAVADARLDACSVAELDGFAAARWINDAFRAARRALFAARAHSQRCPVGIETSLLVAVVARRQVIIGHAGHSRAYRWRGDLAQLTSDHVHEATVLERAEGEHRPSGLCSSVPLRGLGDVGRVDVEITAAPVTAGDYLLVCSNGLTAAISGEAFAEAFRAGRAAQAVAQALLDGSERAHAEDDTTVIVVRVGTSA